MKTKLISITRPTVLDVHSAEDLIAYTARVSNPSNQINSETAPKLLGYLIKNHHWSPFEMVSMTVEIQTSRGIAAQILRHRSFSFQEFSQRYAEAQEVEYYDARRQDSKNRQNSIDDMGVDDKTWFQVMQEKHWHEAMGSYQAALTRGIAKEQARFLLPLGTKTKLYMSGTARSWIHYLQLRCGNGTQLEHRAIADGIKKIFIDQFPHTSVALEWKD